MQFLSSGPDDLNRGLVPSETFLPQEARIPQMTVNPVAEEEDGGTSIDPVRLLRRYWLLLATLTILGASAGFVSIVLSTPRYRTRLLVEVQNSNGSLPRNMSNGGGSSEDNDLNIQTQISILHSGSFLKRGADRMQSETVPLAPTGRDFFSRLRQRIHPATVDPIESSGTGLSVAMATFDARPVLRTRLIELSCES